MERQIGAVDAGDAGEAVGRLGEQVVRVTHECNADGVGAVVVMQPRAGADTIETHDRR